MTRASRHAKILELIGEKEIETQEELAKELNRLGYNITQATVSRDINELGLVKVNGAAKKYRYAYQDVRDNVSNKIMNLFRECVVSVKSTKNLIVVKTLNGCGSQAGTAVDKLNMPEILGSVAGDDTLLVIARSDEDVPAVLDKFQDILH